MTEEFDADALLASAVWVFVALHLRSPYLLPLRDSVFWIWIAVGGVAAVFLFLQRNRLRPGFHPLHLAACAAVLGSAFAGMGHWNHSRNRQKVLNTSARAMPEIGKHLVVGFQQDGDFFRRGAQYVDKVLRGTKPADLPVEQPTVFELGQPQ